MNVNELKQIAESCFNNPSENNRTDKEVAWLILKLLAVVDAAKELLEDMRVSPDADYKLAKALKELES